MLLERDLFPTVDDYLLMIVEIDGGRPTLRLAIRSLYNNKPRINTKNMTRPIMSFTVIIAVS